MLKSELLEIIASGESSGIEFKRDDVRPEQLAKEIVAMANLKGGRLLLGVEDDGSISGVQRPDLEEWVMDTVFAAKVHPMLLPFYEEVALDDGERVAVVTISEGPSKPYVVRHQGREEIYIRMGTTSRRATREQQARLHQAGGMLHTEVLPVSGTGLDALDRQRLRDYLQHVMRDTALPDSDQQWMTRLASLGFMTDSVGSERVCTIAGLLLFGLSPRRFLRQGGVRVMVFDALEKTYAATFDEALDGPLVGLWITPDGQEREFVDDGLIERIASVLRPYLRAENGAIGEGLRRDDVGRFANEVVREVLVNSLAHRDWTRLNDIELVVYADRLELTSPGPLPNTMTIEKMVAGQRCPRNPIIVDVLRDYGYVDARGMGVRNKIIPLVRQATGRDPAFEETEDYLKTTIPAAGLPAGAAAT